MPSVWAATGAVLLLALIANLCLPALTLPASHVVPPAVRHRAAPEPVMEIETDHGHAAKLKVFRESATNPHAISDPTMQHKVIPDQGASSKVIPELDLKHKVTPESSSRHEAVPELATNHKVALEPKEKDTVVSGSGVKHRVVNKPMTRNKVVPEPAAKHDGIPSALRPGGVEAMPELRPGQVRPGHVGNDAATTTTTTSTTTVDPFTAFCQEACKAGVGGPECNCPGHPVGRRHAPPLTP